MWHRSQKNAVFHIPVNFFENLRKMYVREQVSCFHTALLVCHLFSTL